MTQVYDVIVLGCGAAGVAALSRLVEEDIKVLGLEGNDRLGGRIKTVTFADNVVDLGAQCCYGEKNNDIYKLVNDLNLLDWPASRKKNVFSNGTVLDTEITDKYHKLLVSIMRTAKKIDGMKTEPIVDFLNSEYKKCLESAEFAVDEDIAREMFEWYIKSTQAKISSNELREKSLNSLKESWDDLEEKWFYWKDKGFKTILDVLLKKYPDPSKELPVEILVNKEVINIKWASTQKANNNTASTVQITCRDGSVFVARHVIVTFSIGVLKERFETLFTPSVPNSKIMSIRSLAMCTMNKIYINFPSTWWPEARMHFGLLWTEEDKKKFVNEESWLTEVYAFATVDFQPTVLCAFVAGTAAEDMELHSSHEVMEKMCNLLKHFLGQTYNIPEPVEVIRSTWYSNPLARGSYSYRSIETEYVDCGAAVLSEPIMSEENLPIVCFAGEATSLHHHSTAHGAVESGFREAERLITLLKRSN